MSVWSTIGQGFTFPAGNADANTWPRLTSGTVMTTAAAGTWEYDGKALYFTAAASSRQTVLCDQWLALNAAYTLANSGAAQKLFDGSTNGAVTLQAGTRYFFHGVLTVSGMSSTSGNALIDILGAGTATVTGIRWSAIGTDGTTLSSGATCNTSHHATVGSSQGVFTGGAGTAMAVSIFGTVRVNAGGTFIPSITLNTAIGTAAVGADSFIRFTAAGPASAPTVGNWS